MLETILPLTLDKLIFSWDRYKKNIKICLLRSEIETEVNHNHYLATLKTIIHYKDLAPSNTYCKLAPSLAFKTGMQKFSRQDLLSQKAEPQKL